MDWKARFVAFADTVWGWFRAGIKLLTAFIGLVLTVAIAITVTAWIVFFGEIFLPSNIVGVPARNDQEGVQFRAVEIAHNSIKTWVLQCVGANSIRDLPENLQSYFRDRYGYATYYGDTSRKTVAKTPTVQEMSIVQLSNAMLNQRVELARKANDSYSWLQYIQWLTILIGLVTTVVVSISTTELFGKVDTPLGKGLRFLAIFLPALGTAVAAINAFYNPRDDWNKASNTLANLTQLHGQMSVGIWALECPADDAKRKDVVAKLEEWTKRYNDVITIAESTPGASKQEQAGQKTGGGTGSGQTGGAQTGGGAGGAPPPPVTPGGT
jgi:hypothetical protein